MDDGIAMVKRLLGLPGMEVLEVIEGDNELVVKVETTATIGWCPRCGVRAEVPNWPNRPTPPILRTSRPHAHA